MSGEQRKPQCFSDQKQVRVLLLEGISQTAVKTFENAGFKVETEYYLNKNDLMKRINSVHIIGIRSKTKLTKEVLKCAGNLLAIGHFCIGTEQTDLIQASQLGVPVFNAPFENTRSVAEMVIAEILMLSRQIGDRNREMHSGTQNRKNDQQCNEIRGKTLGIVGYGDIGEQLSILAESLGMFVNYYDIEPKLTIGNAQVVDDLSQLLKTSDFISLHVPLTKKTRHLIDEKKIQLMKKGSFLINASRSALVDTSAVRKALDNGHLAGVGFDVFDIEPVEKYQTGFENILIGAPNTILTPHIGGTTVEAQTHIGLATSRKIVDYVNNGVSVGAVNFPRLNLEPPISKTRLMMVYRNVTGLRKKINLILEKYNVEAEFLATQNEIGYMVVDLKSDSVKGKELLDKLTSMEESIRTRIVQ